MAKGWQIDVTDAFGTLPDGVVFRSKRKAMKRFVKLDRDFGEFCALNLVPVKIK